jgi:two-component system sensor kinase
VFENWEKALEKAKLNNTDIRSAEYQVTCKTGIVRTIIISGITLPDGFLATFTDITEIKQAEIAINNLNQNLESSVKDRTNELNKKAHKLEKSQQALTYLLEDVNDIKKQLVISNSLLSGANKELEAFSYSVSHDLKAPLRAVIGFSQILIEDFESQLDVDAKRYIGLIIDNAENMGALINDLLNFSRLGRKEIKKSQVDLAEISQRVKEELLEGENGRNINIEILPMPKISADKNLLYHVMLNLISNAVKFTNQTENAKIEIGCITNTGENIFYVKDNGIGFNMKYSGKIFDVFQRLHTIEEFPGTGIGLSIVQRIIHKHKGKIWVESELNKGTTLHFKL